METIKVTKHISLDKLYSENEKKNNSQAKKYSKKKYKNETI